MLNINGSKMDYSLNKVLSLLFYQTLTLSCQVYIRHQTFSRVNSVNLQHLKPTLCVSKRQDL